MKLTTKPVSLYVTDVYDDGKLLGRITIMHSGGIMASMANYDATGQIYKAESITDALEWFERKERA